MKAQTTTITITVEHEGAMPTRDLTEAIDAATDVLLCDWAGFTSCRWSHETTIHDPQEGAEPMRTSMDYHRDLAADLLDGLGKLFDDLSEPGGLPPTHGTPERSLWDGVGLAHSALDRAVKESSR